jgi:hypothetical protein
MRLLSFRSGTIFRELLSGARRLGLKLTCPAIACGLLFSYPGSGMAQVFGTAPAPSSAVESAPPRAPSLVQSHPATKSGQPHATSTHSPLGRASSHVSRRKAKPGKATPRRNVSGHTASNSSRSVISIQRENAPPSAPAPDETTKQKTADRRLLRQQEAQSANEEQQQNTVLQQVEARRAEQQNQVRVQDAPGPAQTGVVPAAGPPVAPINNGRDIQDAPGPTQTLPQPAQTPPVQTSPSPTVPASSPPQ